MSGPDLTISATAPSTAVASNNASIPVSWTVTNSSSEDALSRWYDAVYLSSTPTLSGSIYTYLASYGRPGSGPLIAGASYTLNENLTIPNVAAGDYYLIFSADYASSQAVTNPADGLVALPITLTAPAVDLVLTQATAPASAVVGNGDSISVSWTVQNQGAEAANDYWYDAVYLSASATLDDTATQLTSQSNSGTSLAPNASYSVTASAAIGNFPTGQAYLIFVANNGAGQGETDRSNNVYSLPIQLNAPGDVDLTISGSGPSSAAVGQAATVSWTVTNQGPSTAAASWADIVYLSHVPVYDSTAVYLTSLNSGDKIPLASGQQYTRTQDITIPTYSYAGSTTGDMYLLFVTNSNDAQAETDTTNDVQAVPITIESSAVDLQVTAATAPATGVLGDAVPISFTVKKLRQRLRARRLVRFGLFVEHALREQLFDVSDQHQRVQSGAVGGRRQLHRRSRGHASWR